MPKLSRRQDVPQFNNYKKYKKYLREDFKYRCVYCSIHENECIGPRDFTVEHFRPKKSFAELVNDYQNLLYGCLVCNPFKGNDWPSDDPLTDGVGYLDPCEHDYSDHFQLNDFEIKGLTPAAVYMIERLHLNRSQLIKLRKIRSEKERKHSETVEGFNNFLEIIDVGIRSGQSLQNKKEIVINQLNTEMERWIHRWDPIHELGDYREEGR